MKAIRSVLVAAIGLGILQCAGWGIAAEPLAEARAKIAQCIEKEGEEYIEGRNWLIEHPEGLDLLGEDSWKQRWVKRICQAWTEQRELYEQRMRGFEEAEARASKAVRTMVPSISGFRMRLDCRRHGVKLLPLMMECLWKTGRHWSRYKAWRVYTVVEYLKLVGDKSVVEPTIDVLAWQSEGGEVTPDPGSEYPRMGQHMRALGELTDQMAPYMPVQLVVMFGNEGTLAKLKSVIDNPGTSEASKDVLRKTVEMLSDRLEKKERGLPVGDVGLLDLYMQLETRRPCAT